MSRLGLKLAGLFGRSLPAFGSLEEASAHLFAMRDGQLSTLKGLASKSGFSADGTPESLKQLEAWYFQLFESDGFGELGVSREEFERCMASYFCEVAVTNCPGTQWHVSEFAYEPGKYEIGVKRGLFELMRGSFKDHHAQQGNRSRNAIYREYRRYFGK